MLSVAKSTSTTTSSEHPNAALSQRQTALVAQTEALLGPIAQLLVSQGIGYAQLLPLLKTVFMQAATEELSRIGEKNTDAAVSLLSGVHRKDVRAAKLETPALAAPASGSLANQVFTRWLADAAFRDREGKATTLPISGPHPSFESLVSSVSKDFHRRTVLDELVRLGLVEEIATSSNITSHVKPIAQAITPVKDLPQLLEQFGSNASDHLAAGVENLRAAIAGSTPEHLEQSVYANGLSADSMAQLSTLARQLWKQNFDQMVHQATQRYEIDAPQKETGRVRFGVYFYHEDAPTKASK
jgi:Family of unknown function (DUF6502)